ncbi:hypothetical protein TNCV_571461 [Trichonephila clavipes]|nr:hypothetical protein TNCV_571461 [Trichonephila clavipes]
MTMRYVKGQDKGNKLYYLTDRDATPESDKSKTDETIMLTVPVSTASAERSFSKLKLIKTYLRSTMSQERLSALSVLSIEAEIVASVSYDIILKKFSEAKSRKVGLL